MNTEKIAEIFPPPTVEDWAASITQAWRESVSGIIEVGRQLKAAREALGDQRGAWGRLIGDNGQKSQLPFGSNTAYRLIAIAEDERLLAHGPVMPASWRTLYDLTQLDDDEFHVALSEGRIHPEMERSDVKPKRRKPEPEQEPEIDEERDFLTPAEADKAITFIAARVDSGFFHATPGILACLVSAMPRASDSDREKIVIAAEFLVKLKDC